jgi:hypothetical protein
MRMPRTALAAIALCLASLSCRQRSHESHPAAIVGVWSVTMPEAPFPYHLFVFHPDGTMQQANPDAGDAHTSDSNGMGVWTPMVTASKASLSNSPPIARPTSLSAEARSPSSLRSAATIFTARQARASTTQMVNVSGSRTPPHSAASASCRSIRSVRIKWPNRRR